MKRILFAMLSSLISNTMVNLVLLRMGIKLPFILSVLLGMGIYFFWYWWFGPKPEDTNTPSGT